MYLPNTGLDHYHNTNLLSPVLLWNPHVHHQHYKSMSWAISVQVPTQKPVLLWSILLQNSNKNFLIIFWCPGFWHHNIKLVVTNVFEKYAVSFFMSHLKSESAESSTSLVTEYQTAWCKIGEDNSLKLHCCKTSNLVKFCMHFMYPISIRAVPSLYK